MLAETSSDQVKLLQLEKQISENKNDIATLKEDKVDGDNPTGSHEFSKKGNTKKPKSFQEKRK